MRVVISSGHGLKIRGASGYLDEVDEARRVIERAAECCRMMGIEAVTFNDDVSTTQEANLDAIVDYHNGQQRDLDVSVHFNAHATTPEPMGTECLYLSQQGLAAAVAAGMANAGGLLDRGAKYRDDLYFLNATNEAAILIEVCFVDSAADADLYRRNFAAICTAIAGAIRAAPAAAGP